MINLAFTELAARLGLSAHLSGAKGLPSSATDLGSIVSINPATGVELGRVQATGRAAYDQAIAAAQATFLRWREVPAPQRGELVRRIGNRLREAKDDLGWLVTLEAGKIRSEGLGEVQEMIDMADFAVGLSRQLHGVTIATERPSHRMMETWHPLGPTGIITSFNFPVAVWAWNAALALVCGNSLIWKPSERTLLSALAAHALFEKAMAKFGAAPEWLSVILTGGQKLGETLVEDPRVPLVSATGSTTMGRAVSERLARRFARPILELSGNNAAIIAPSADLNLALRAIAFAAMGTAGQRCTTLRRLIVHESIYDAFVARLRNVFNSAAIGDPRVDGTLVGPLIDRQAFEAMQQALARARATNARVTGGARVLADRHPAAFYVKPALVELATQTEVVKRETFAPLLYCLTYRDLDAAIAVQNDVPQGLAASIFTQDLREAEMFLSAIGADCGLANVNIGPSGAEIGGAFGGEKETGGGRESGSDSWKGYMRRATNTINYGTMLQLAQGVRFDIEG